ncbi:MAG: hypothetical protein WCL30_00415 [Pseudomonadota bacterium]
MTNKIHPTAIIEGNVELGSGNEIGPYSVLYGPLKIGDNNLISPNVVIGTLGQDTRNPRYDGSNSPIEIGNNNIIREGTAIHKPCYKDITKIGNNTYIMHSVHIPHDAIIEDDVVITPMVAMGGIVTLMQGANIALGVTVQQYCVIGQYSIAAMGSAVTRNIRPFCKYIPGKGIFVNDYAVNKYGFADVAEQIEDYVLRNVSPQDANLQQIIARFDAAVATSGRQTY